MTEILKYPSVAKYPNGHATTASNHYKNWSYLSRLAGSTTNPAICYDSNSSPLAGKNGTYNRPSPIELLNFGFDIPSGVKVEKVVVYYSQKKVELSSPIGRTAYPNIKGAKFTLLNCNGVYKTGVSVSSVYTSNKLEFTGITRDQLNSSDFGVKIEYPANASTNPGKVWLGNVYVVVYTTNQTVYVSIDNQNKGVNLKANYNLTLESKYEGSDSFTCDIALDLPANTTYVSKIDGDGNLIESGGNRYWRVSFSAASQKKITLSFMSTTKGSKKFLLVSGTHSASTTVYVEDYQTDVSNTLAEIKNITVGTLYSYEIILTSNDPNSRREYVEIRFPLGCTINNLSSLQSAYNAQTRTGKILLLYFYINFVGRKSIPISVTFNSSGYEQQYIWINSVRKSLVEYEVESQNKGNLTYEFVEIPSLVCERMGHNVTYVGSCMGKWDSDNTSVNIKDYGNNLRFGVCNSNIDDPYSEEFIDHVTWCDNIAVKSTWNEQKVTFKYDENNPLFFVWSFCYENETPFNYVEYNHSEPVLVEQTFYDDVGEDKVLLLPSSNLREKGQYASCILPAGESTAPILCYGWDISELENYLSSTKIGSIEDVVLHGIEVNLDYSTNEPIIIESQLHLPEGNSSSRSNVVNKGSGTVTLGSEYDMWNYKISLLRDNLTQLGVIMNVINHGNNNADVEICNLELKITYLIKENIENYGFTVDGEKSVDYGIYLTNIKVPFGTDYSHKEYHVDGTDETIITQSNIDSKTIELEVSIDACGIEDTVYLIKKLEMLFNNKRNVITNKPEPMKVGFDIIPDWHYDVVRVEQFDGEFENGYYNTKIKLTVPNGVRVSNTMTCSGKTGSTNGVSNIRPLVYVKCYTDGELNVVETYSGLKCIFKDARIASGDNIVIDSENRKVTLLKAGDSSEINLINSVDLSTNWFVLNGEYSFESDTGSVYQVSYYEKI